MARLYTNNYSTTLNGAIDNSTTTITVNSVAALPAIGGGATCNLTINDGTNVEIVTATAVSGSDLTVTRGVESTSGTAFADAVRIHLNPTAASFDADWTLISSATASASATIEFTSGITSAYSAIKVFVTGLIPATDTANMTMQFSDDAGSTWKNTNYSWARWAFDENASTGALGSTSDSAARVVSFLGTGTNEIGHLELTVFNPSATTFTAVNSAATTYDAAAIHSSDTTTALYQGTEVIDGIRFIMSTGNIASGVFQVYGIRK